MGLLEGDSLNYFAVPWGVADNKLPLVVVLGLQVALMGAAEKYRSDLTGPPGYSPGTGKFESDVFNGLDNLSPGGPFDPLGLADDPDLLAELRSRRSRTEGSPWSPCSGLPSRAPLPERAPTPTGAST